MTRWTWLLALPGGSVLITAIWLRRRWLAREAAEIQKLIHPPNQTYAVLDKKAVETVQAEAARRRAAFEYQRKCAAKVASGEVVEERIRLVK